MSSSMLNMEDRIIYLVGIDPPSNLLTRLVEINRALFRSFGIVSGLSLDPVIPVCALARQPDRPQLGELARIPALSTAQWEIVEETLFLGLEPEDRLQRTIAEAQSRLHWACVRPELLPMFPGIYLTRLDDPAPAERWPEVRAGFSANGKPRREAVLAEVGPPPKLRWTGAGLTCRRISYGEEMLWLDGIESETIWTVRLRGER